MDTRLNIYEFGKRLLETRDLDPVYVILHEAQLESALLRRWLLAYWCFYHMGTASWIAEGYAGYWKRMYTAAGSKEYPRAAERRHFRGANARKSVDFLSTTGVHYLYAPLSKHTEYPLEVVTEYVQTWVGFGPWIAFKVSDMLERLGIVRIRFDKGAMFLFDSPREGAEHLWTVEKGSSPTNGEANLWAVEKLVQHFSATSAPPRHERTINAQEAETILCKWLAHTKGRYRVGEDVDACYKALERFRGRSRLAERLYEAAEKSGLKRRTSGATRGSLRKDYS